MLEDTNSTGTLNEPVGVEGKKKRTKMIPSKLNVALKPSEKVHFVRLFFLLMLIYLDFQIVNNSLK